MVEALVLTWPEARDLAARLARAATAGGPGTWSAGARLLAELDGRSWLLLDEAARAPGHDHGTPVSGDRGWLTPGRTATSGFVAAVASLHADGRVREQACRVLESLSGPIPTTALAVRLLDHVPQVRDRAQQALAGTMDLASAVPVLDVVLAGRGRRQAQTALLFVEGVLLQQVPPRELVDVLLREGPRRVRRWALVRGHDLQVLEPARLLSIVGRDPDQWVRAAAADLLIPVADRAQLHALLQVDTVEARLGALGRAADDVLDDVRLRTLLSDRAPRVREEARRRADARGLDPSAWYRQMVARGDVPDHVRAAALDGLGVVGGPDDLGRFVMHLEHPGVRVRAAAVAGVSTHAPREDSHRLLGPMLLDPAPRVCAVAARGLVRRGAPQSVVEPAWTSTQAWSRLAAWRTSRGGGGWDRLEADLRAAAGDDDALVARGVMGVRGWLQSGAATTWGDLSEAQRERIGAWLVAGAVDDGARRVIGFHAGLDRR